VAAIMTQPATRATLRLAGNARGSPGGESTKGDESGRASPIANHSPVRIRSEEALA
jgi:hypothetical protein